jgi:hypothetical protein
MAVRRNRLDAREERDVLDRAWVPEHVPGLMEIVSGATPFLMDDHLALAGRDLAILVGYPLDREGSPGRTAEAVRRLIRERRPCELRLIAPELPADLPRVCEARETDTYLTLDPSAEPSPRLARIAERAAASISVERGGSFTAEHVALADQLRREKDLPSAVDALYAAMPEYMARSETALLLSARNSDGRLAAFFVLETSARAFDAYLLGAHAKERHASHASDLLFLEMIRVAREGGKENLHLGLGVNEGIRRFKTKWGGRPTVPYESCRPTLRRPRIPSLFRLFLGGGR